MSTESNSSSDATNATDAAANAPAAPNSNSQAPRRNVRMRRELLTKLPRIGFTKLQVAEQFLVEEDLGTIDLTPDAILSPLESIAGDDR